MIRIHHNFDPGEFSYLWAKYVNGGNPTQHCYICLKGMQSKVFGKAYNPDMGNQPDLEMNEKPEGSYDAIYFCGVSKKGYVHNVHLVVRPAEGVQSEWKFENWKVSIENGVVEGIPCPGELRPEYFNEPYTEHHYTCRNFLWMMGKYHPEAFDATKLKIRVTKDSDGYYDTDNAIPMGMGEWRGILRDMSQNDVVSWNMLREFHKAKDNTAYVRDVAKTLGMTRRQLLERIEALGLLVAGRNGGFRIVRRLNDKAETWWPVFFNLHMEPEMEHVFTLRRDVVRVMDDMTKTNRGASSRKQEGKGIIGYPTFHFFEMGLKVGDELTFTEDPSIKAVIATNRKVTCNGKETYLTPLTAELRGKKGPMGKYWVINGKTIDDLYYETYFPKGKTFAEYQAEEAERRKNQ